jgi:hypothetical protein
MDELFLLITDVSIDWTILRYWLGNKNSGADRRRYRFTRPNDLMVCRRPETGQMGPDTGREGSR